MAGDHGLALTFVLAIDGIAILSALATGHEDRAHTRRGAFPNRRTLSVRALRAVTTLGPREPIAQRVGPLHCSDILLV